MGKAARRALANQGQPLIITNPTTTMTAPNNTIVTYQCTCYRRRCRCGASGVRIVDANGITTSTSTSLSTVNSLSMLAQQRLVGMSQPYGHGHGYQYGCGGGRHRRARRQGPITALVGGLINLAIEKHDEKKAKRAAEEAVEERQQVRSQTREVDDEASESDTEVDEGAVQRTGVVRSPSETKTSKKAAERNVLRKEPVVYRSQRAPEQSQAPPPYSA